MTPKTEEDLIYESVIDLSKIMAQSLAERAMKLYDNMTEDERKKILPSGLIGNPHRYAAAKVLLLAASEVDSNSSLYLDFSAESILKNIKSAKRIVRQRR